ncbi:MAG: hypothetical protein IPP42_06215 [Saprospiraceae bacterium]|nr:hypothetical protein [Saprospiraceae bacterium]
MSYDVKETKPDNTHGYSAVTDVTLFTLPSNYEIISLNGTTGYSKSIEDLSHEIYAIPFSKGPIDRIELQGDNDGEDLGKCDRNHSYVQVYFRQNHSISVRKL